MLCFWAQLLIIIMIEAHWLTAGSERQATCSCSLCVSVLQRWPIGWDCRLYHYTPSIPARNMPQDVPNMSPTCHVPPVCMCGLGGPPHINLQTSY